MTDYHHFRVCLAVFFILSAVKLGLGG